MTPITIKNSIIANLSTGLPWAEWSKEEKDLFTLMFYQKDCSTEEDFKYQRRNLMRRLFNRLDVVKAPSFLDQHFRNIRDTSRYREEITDLRIMILKKGIARAGYLPPIY